MQRLTLQERRECFVKAARKSKFITFLFVLLGVFLHFMNQLGGVPTTADMIEPLAQLIFIFGGIAAFAEFGRMYIEFRLQEEA
ncbi:hypothetical protein EAW52_25245 [Pseudomonas sp. LTJR-52]|uniref:hypothetical protein n=1 Tax=Pseudomonas sp. LTJR-52 TaxID=2479392 RepID=UPI000EFB1C9C|nr:hypothetical protein [Pseudomonas sp. LTJR-52]AYN96997.1 hypothetical protein EAW52_25245 [Pseudomonas sp. LTJR-52]